MKNLLGLVLMLVLAGTTYGGDLDGLWVGKYAYPDGSPQEPVTFSVVIKGALETGEFSGKLIEVNTFGNENAVALEADVNGKLETNGELTFSKKYNGVGDQRHTVWYKAKLENGVVNGTWKLEDDFGGAFQMRKVSTR